MSVLISLSFRNNNRRSRNKSILSAETKVRVLDFFLDRIELFEDCSRRREDFFSLEWDKSVESLVIGY